MNEGATPTEEPYGQTLPFEPKRQPSLLHRTVPVSQELPGYRGRSAQRDVLAGVTVAALAAGLTQSFPVGASGSRTAVNDSMGVRTQLGGLVAAGAILALVFAVGLSIVDVVRRSARPHDAVLGWVEKLGRYGDIALHRSARVTPGVVVYRLDDRLFFANAGYFTGRVLEAVRGAPTATRSVVFDAEAVTHVDATGLAALEGLDERLREVGIELSIARAKTPLIARLSEGGLSGIPLYATVRAAVEAAV